MCTHRHSRSREIRIARAINRLHRLYVMRRADGRATAHLVKRCGLLNRAYLDALHTSRSSAESAFSAH